MTHLDAKNLRHYIEAQLIEIKKFKWIESEKVGYDIGEQEAAIRWIDLYAKEFHEYWIDNFKTKKNK